MLVHDGGDRGSRHRPEHRLRGDHLLQPGRLRGRGRLRGGRARRPWPWPPARPRWPWPGGPASGGRDPGPGRTRRPSSTCPGQWTRPAGHAAAGGRDRHADPAVHARVRRHAGAPGQRGHGGAEATPTGTRTAIMYAKPMSQEDYMAARWVSEPLCLFDNCLETDGALACVIVSAERARDLGIPRSTSTPSPRACPPEHQTMVNFYNDDPLTGPAWACARRLWANADFGPRRRLGGPDLRRLHPAHPAVPRGLRVLPARRGGAIHREREPRVGPGVAAR